MCRISVDVGLLMICTAAGTYASFTDTGKVTSKRDRNTFKNNEQLLAPFLLTRWYRAMREVLQITTRVKPVCRSQLIGAVMAAHMTSTCIINIESVGRLWDGSLLDWR